MKIKKWIDYSQEVEIDLSSEDISLILGECEGADGVKNTFYEINSIATFLKGIPDSIITEMSDGQKEAISAFFEEQGKRFK
jgi:hypothetical protein